MNTQNGKSRISGKVGGGGGSGGDGGGGGDRGGGGDGGGGEDGGGMLLLHCGIVPISQKSCFCLTLPVMFKPETRCYQILMSITVFLVYLEC